MGASTASRARLTRRRLLSLISRRGDFVIEKRRYSAFFQTGLRLLLDELGVDTLICCGMDTNICTFVIRWQMRISIISPPSWSRTRQRRSS